MRLPWITGGSKPIIGIDLSSDSVKLVELEKSCDRYDLSKFSRIPLKTGAVTDGEISDAIAVSAALETIKRDSKVRHADVATALFGHSVIVKQVTMDTSFSESDIEAQAWVEANRHFPELINEVYLDFQILGTNKKDQNLLDVLLVACRKNIVDYRAEVLAAAGFNPKIVDVDYYAIYRATELLQNQVLDGGVDKLIAYLHLDANIAVLLVINNNDLIYTHSQTFNGSSIINLAKQELQVDDWLHGYMYKANDLTDEQRLNLANIINPNLVPNIRRLLQYFYSASNHDVLDQLVLSGECVLLPDVAKDVGEQLMMPTVVANPFASININKNLNEDVIRAAGPAMMVCAGLALRGASE